MNQQPPYPNQPQQPQQSYSGQPGFNPYQSQQPFRPEPPKNRARGFLLVLCILTFVGSGLGFLSAISSLFQNPDEAIRAMGISQGLMNDSNVPYVMREYFDGMLEFMYGVFDFYYLYYIITIFTYLGCIIGAFLMLKLKKPGFYIYTGMGLIQMFLPLAVVVNSVTAFMVGIGGLFTVLFIVLYGINLKHMNR